MEQQSDNLRERLLSRLPHPENLTAYREETAALLAKHERALSTEKWTTSALSLCGLVAIIFFSWMVNTHPFDVSGQLRFLGGTLVFVLLVAVIGVRRPIYASQVATLKEIKQVQLQILELQVSLRKEQLQDGIK
jgi:hypothetical protein